MFCGFLSNHIDIAPNYAGTLMAITNTVATIPGIIMPIFVGAVTHGNVSILSHMSSVQSNEFSFFFFLLVSILSQPTISAWRIVFFVTIGLYVIEIIAYTLFGSGEEQPWNKSQARELIGVSTSKTNSDTTPLKGRDGTAQKE